MIFTKPNPALSKHNYCRIQYTRLSFSLLRAAVTVQIKVGRGRERERSVVGWLDVGLWQRRINYSHPPTAGHDVALVTPSQLDRDSAGKMATLQMI